MLNVIAFIMTSSMFYCHEKIYLSAIIKYSNFQKASWSASNALQAALIALTHRFTSFRT